MGLGIKTACAAGSHRPRPTRSYVEALTAVRPAPAGRRRPAASAAAVPSASLRRPLVQRRSGRPHDDREPHPRARATRPPMLRCLIDDPGRRHDPARAPPRTSPRGSAPSMRPSRSDARRSPGRTCRRRHRLADGAPGAHPRRRHGRTWCRTTNPNSSAPACSEPGRKTSNRHGLYRSRRGTGSRRSWASGTNCPPPRSTSGFL